MVCVKTLWVSLGKEVYGGRMTEATLEEWWSAVGGRTKKSVRMVVCGEGREEGRRETWGDDGGQRKQDVPLRWEEVGGGGKTCWQRPAGG
ncbi:hypothetical protein FH972_026061 [Carpinus fangiana]|uniref:Uncharacterized protein n=1 Tax=Carpinus fangiana TaxID=176857 RepID=A0A5N6L2V0_9ROSI|nr:hypothetical protein FH972_026061 [Carpinus fangiana]